MKIITWNVNGIRSRIFNEQISSKLKKNEVICPQESSPMKKLIDDYSPDVICIQETRCGLENAKKISIPGYKSLFNESKLDGARAADRYSGTAVFYRENMNVLEISTTFPGYEDPEGRVITITFESFTCITVYAPNSGTNFDNKIYFMDAMIEYLNNINGPVVFCGDLNVAISTHFDKTLVAEGPGYYKHELEFYTNLQDIGYIDAIKDDDIVYTWWDPRARKENGIAATRNRNKGWRLDYFFTKNFNSNQIVSKCLKHIGENNESLPLASDHAPVLLEIKNTFTES
jgi:exodeoxyribonuclease-3